MKIQTLKNKLREYCSVPSLVLFALATVAAAVHLASALSPTFSDFFNRHIGSLVRGALAMLTSALPFSLAETIVVLLPIIFILVVALSLRAASKSITGGIRRIVSMASALSLLYSLFVFTTAVGYNGTSLSYKLGLDERPVSTDELRSTAEYMISKMNEELDDVTYAYGEGSVMPYSLGEMNALLLEALDSASDKYAFLPRLASRIKPIALSEPMTYTHISGMYTYYTGESNLNINFPDYNLPFTAAHELAHQRGIMRENEANFVAFLICTESDDPYVRYSGYISMYEYLSSALYNADYDIFADIYTSLDGRVIGEITAYNNFFEKYRKSVASEISGVMNNTYLKAQGVDSGEKSYGMVVDLACAWVATQND